MQDCEVRVAKYGSLQVTKFYKNGIFIGKHIVHLNEDEYWYNDKGQYHSFNDEPAIVSDVSNGAIVHRWYKNDLIHRDNGPASVWYRDGQIVGQYWYKYDKRHREDGPTCIHYDTSGTLSNEWLNSHVYMRYKDVPEVSRLPPSLRAAMLVLPLPIGNEILHQCEWLWPFE